ncbi:TonB-dependent receptor plug domain-containing protein [Porphyrobacter sp. LM 6]|uniref:TonB-dependent receptor plug domain-containing protein n=1 Tax=Porphyrobacter sp. LM 6 TaxID=1896196 RepID=UPI00084745A3|nr:TonB-dependent receptor [Porphyrobacter sp. LM 6]AOL94107.1 TonB-dependent outer membrane channel [Porphyrobacter sp. LM 6]
MKLRALLLASLVMPAAPAFAQDAAQAVEEAGQPIVVTGSRRADRTVGDSAVPIDLISADQINNTGFTETARVLRDLVPSLNFPQPSITDGTDVIRPATLRGLGADQTLVLINGKRRHASALLNINGSVGRGTQAVDINFIPASAITQIEVLRDGAAAQYGSDAIAGVINFQLNNAREGATFSATYGGYVTAIDSVQEVTGLVLGANGQPVLAADGTLAVNDTGRKLKVEDGAMLTLSSNFALPLGDEGFINLTAEYRDRDDTNRTGYDRRTQYNIVGGLRDPREQTFDRRSHRYGDARTEDFSLFANVGMPLGEQVELYAFGGYGERRGNSAGFYRIASDARNVVAIYPDGFLPLITSKSKDWSVTGGIKGEIAGWDFDLSSQYGENAIDYRIINTLNASLGAASPTEFEAGGLTYNQWVNNFDISRDIEGLFERTTLAFGLEYRRESFQVSPGEPDSYRSGGVTINQNNPLNTSTAGAAPGSQVFPGFQPTIGGVSVVGVNARNNFSAYAELDIDVIEPWNVQIAGRYEDYSDFGSDWNGKIATRFELADWVALRGAVSTGFRAPGVAQQFFAAAATNNVAGVLVDAVTLPVGNPVAQALGSSPLKPETAVNWSVGAVFTPVDRFNLTVDWFQIDIDDRIVLTENLTATRDAAGNPSGTGSGRAIAQILNDAGFNTISAARFFINGIDTRTRGVDAIATYRMDIGSEGKLNLMAGYNWTDNKITGRNAAPGALNQVPGINLFGRLESLRIEQGQPRDRINLGADYSQDWASFTLRANRFGRVLAPGNDVFTDLPIEAAWVFDLEVRAEPVDGLELAVGSNNLFDQYPTANPVGVGRDPATGNPRNYSPNNYFLPFSSFSPFGFNGRFVYGRVSYRF